MLRAILHVKQSGSLLGQVLQTLQGRVPVLLCPDLEGKEDAELGPGVSWWTPNHLRASGLALTGNSAACYNLHSPGLHFLIGKTVAH